MNTSDSVAKPGFFSRQAPLLSAALALVVSCSKTPIKPDTNPASETPSTSVAATPVAPAGPPFQVFPGSASSSAVLAKQLTSSGDNSDPRYSPDATRIVFVSRLRSNHKQAQVYELHLARMTEKRITFHDGDDLHPVYTPDGSKILFSSTTDEIKEAPYVIDRLMKNYEPELFEKRKSTGKGFRDMAFEGFEIYQQTLHGRTIERFTHSSGFDGDADVDPKGKRVVISSNRDPDGMHLFMIRGQSISRLTTGKVIDRGARFSPDGKSLLWTRQSEGRTEETKIMIATGDFKKPRVLVEDGLNLQPAWAPDGTTILFSSNRAGGKLNLFLIDSAGKCMRRLTEVDIDQAQPVVSPDSKHVLFTGIRKSRQNIFEMDYRPTTDCLVLAKPTPAPNLNPTPPPSPTPTASPTPPIA